MNPTRNRSDDLMSEQQHRLFSYGSLQDPAVQMRLVGRTIPMTPDALRGYVEDQVAMEGGVYPMLRPAPDGTVPLIAGVVLMVSGEELARFDLYETAVYARVEVTLESGVTAWVYVAAG
jgi:hypothetical protein